MRNKSLSRIISSSLFTKGGGENSFFSFCGSAKEKGLIDVESVSVFNFEFFDACVVDSDTFSFIDEVLFREAFGKSKTEKDFV